MQQHCLNCGYPVNEKYCPQCGQSTQVSRISWASFGAEFVRTLTHAEKSIAGTTWQLLRRPGYTLDEYFKGKRKKYSSPVSFFLVWVTLSILIHRIIIAHSGFHPVYMEGLTFSTPESIHAFITHGEWFYILTFPLSAALLYFILANSRYSYIECIVITMYAFSVTYMFYVFCYLLGGGLFSLNVLHWAFYLFQIILSLAYTLYACIDLFRNKGIRWVWLRILLFIIINSIVVLNFLEFLSRVWVRLEEHVHL